MGMVPKAGGYKRVSACIFWDYHILLKEQNRSLSRSHCLRESRERWCPPSALEDRYLFIKSVKMDSGWFLSKDWLLKIFYMCVLVLMEKTWSYNKGAPNHSPKPPHFKKGLQILSKKTLNKWFSQKLLLSYVWFLKKMRKMWWQENRKKKGKIRNIEEKKYIKSINYKNVTSSSFYLF